MEWVNKLMACYERYATGEAMCAKADQDAARIEDEMKAVGLSGDEVAYAVEEAYRTRYRS